MNLFVDITDQDDEESDDIDMYGIYGSYTIAGITLLAGYSESGEDGAYGEDEVLDLGIGYEGGPIAAGIGYQDVDSLDDESISAFASYAIEATTITAYYEELGDSDVVALNVSYSFTDNFYVFFETADYSEESGEADNSEVGLVLTF